MFKGLLMEMLKLNTSNDREFEIFSICTKAMQEVCDCGFNDPQSKEIYARYIEMKCLRKLVELKASLEIIQEVKKISQILRVVINE
jgi:hypothetical protein